MKRNIILLLCFAILFLTYCTSSKKTASVSDPVSYEKSIQPVVAASCGPCHPPSKGGKKPPLESHTDVAYNIDDIIRRIEMHPGQKGFMPMKKERLSDSAINLFKDWKTAGLLK